MDGRSALRPSRESAPAWALSSAMTSVIQRMVMTRTNDDLTTFANLYTLNLSSISSWMPAQAWAVPLLLCASAVLLSYAYLNRAHARF